MRLVIKSHFDPLKHPHGLHGWFAPTDSGGGKFRVSNLFGEPEPAKPLEPMMQRAVEAFARLLERDTLHGPKGFRWRVQESDFLRLISTKLTGADELVQIPKGTTGDASDYDSAYRKARSGELLLSQIPGVEEDRINRLALVADVFEDPDFILHDKATPRKYAFVKCYGSGENAVWVGFALSGGGRTLEPISYHNRPLLSDDFKKRYALYYSREGLSWENAGIDKKTPPMNKSIEGAVRKRPWITGTATEPGLPTKRDVFLPLISEFCGVRQEELYPKTGLIFKAHDVPCCRECGEWLDLDDDDADLGGICYGCASRKPQKQRDVPALIRQLHQRLSAGGGTSINKAHATGYPLQGRTTFQGLDISIENRKGSVRQDTLHDPPQWRTKMVWPYGYIRRSESSADHDHVDCYIGPNPDAPVAYIINQVDPKTKKFDEQKVMLGFDSPEDAKKAYLLHYDSPDFFGDMQAMPMEEFKSKVLATLPKGGGIVKACESGDKSQGDKYEFCSTQIDLPESFGKRICAWAYRNLKSYFQQERKHGDPNRKYGVELHSHVTVKYGIQNGDPDACARLLVKLEPIHVQLGKLNAFTSNPDFDVLYIEVESPDLHDANRVLATHLKCVDTHPEYHPHVTIAYLPKGEAAKFVGDDTFAGTEWTFDEVMFSTRSGALVALPLRGHHDRGPYQGDGYSHLDISRRAKDFMQLFKSQFSLFDQPEPVPGASASSRGASSHGSASPFKGRRRVGGTGSQHRGSHWTDTKPASQPAQPKPDIPVEHQSTVEVKRPGQPARFGIVQGSSKGFYNVRIPGYGTLIVPQNEVSAVDTPLPHDPDLFQRMIPQSGTVVDIAAGEYSNAGHTEQKKKTWRAVLGEDISLAHPSALITVHVPDGRKTRPVQVPRGAIIGPHFVAQVRDKENQRRTRTVASELLTEEARKQRATTAERVLESGDQELLSQVEHAWFEEHGQACEAIGQRTAAGYGLSHEETGDVISAAFMGALRGLRAWYLNPAKEREKYLRYQAAEDGAGVGVSPSHPDYARFQKRYLEVLSGQMTDAQVMSAIAFGNAKQYAIKAASELHGNRAGVGHLGKKNTAHASFLSEFSDTAGFEDSDADDVLHRLSPDTTQQSAEDESEDNERADELREMFMDDLARGAGLSSAEYYVLEEAIQRDWENASNWGEASTQSSTHIGHDDAREVSEHLRKQFGVKDANARTVHAMWDGVKEKLRTYAQTRPDILAVIEGAALGDMQKSVSAMVA